MADEPENLTLRLLQEMREEMRDLRQEGQQTRAQMLEMRQDLTQRVNGISVILSSIAGIAHDHEERIAAIEARSPSA